MQWGQLTSAAAGLVTAMAAVACGGGDDADQVDLPGRCLRVDWQADY